MKLHKLFFLAVLPVIIFSCQKNVDVSVTAKIMLNVQYGTDPLQNMDVYLPVNRSASSTKFIVLIHGGAWESGDKTDLSPYVDSLQKRLPDYAVININYRLAAGTINLFPTQENDVKACIAFIAGKTSEYLISQKMVLLGTSAGGHLALLQGYKYTSPIVPKAIVSFFGPTDLTDMYNHPTNPLVSIGLAAVVGKTPSQDSALYANSSPINFVKNSSPPTILLHGGIDPLVSPTQATALQAKLQVAGVINQYVFYPTEGHGWYGANLYDSFNKVVAFIKANVN